MLEKFVFLLPAGLKVFIKVPAHFSLIFPIDDCPRILQIGLSMTRSSLSVSLLQAPSSLEASFISFSHSMHVT